MTTGEIIRNQFGDRVTVHVQVYDSEWSATQIYGEVSKASNGAVLILLNACRYDWDHRRNAIGTCVIPWAAVERITDEREEAKEIEMMQRQEEYEARNREMQTPDDIPF
jgi:hypothetical protein